MALSNLSPSDIRQLTEILRLTSDDTNPIFYNNRITRRIEALPSRLKHHGLLKRLLFSPTRHTIDPRPADQRGPLCPLHHKLNASIIHKLFTLVALEVGRNLNHVAQNLHELNDEQQAWLARMRALHAIWYNPEKYELLFCQPSHETKWTYQGNKCAACTLSLIAGDLNTVLDLLRALTSRHAYSERRSKPRLHSWLMAWLDHHEDEQHSDTSRKDFKRQVYENGVRAFDLKDRRKEFHKRRKAERTAAKRSSLQPVPEDEPLHLGDDEVFDRGRIISLHADDNDDALETVDLDAALLSTPHLPNMSREHQDDIQRSMSRLSLHSAGGQQQTHNSSRTPSLTHQTSFETISVSSRTSIGTLGAKLSHPPQGSRRSADEAAKSYTNVIQNENPFVSSASIPRRRSLDLRGSKERHAIVTSVRDGFSDVDSMRHDTSSTQQPSVSTLTSYARAIPPGSARSSVVEQYADYASHGPTAVQIRPAPTVRPQEPTSARDLPLRRAPSTTASVGRRASRTASNTVAHSGEDVSHARWSQTGFNRPLASPNPSHRRKSISSHSQSRPVSRPDSGYESSPTLINPAAMPATIIAQIQPQPQTQPSRTSRSSIRREERRRSSKSTHQPSTQPSGSSSGSQRHHQQLHESPTASHTGTTSTQQTRWSTHWRESVEGRPGNAFYRERMQYAKNDGR